MIAFQASLYGAGFYPSARTIERYLSRKKCQSVQHSSIQKPIANVTQTLPYLVENQELLVSITEKLQPVPGFQKTVRFLIASAHHPSSAKGYLYELEKAAEVHRSQMVTALNIVFMGRQFDIFTTAAAIECKNIRHWPFRGNKATTMREQFLAQKALLETYNALHNSQLHLIVASKEPLPCKSKWRAWFCKNGIKLEEGESANHTEAAVRS